MKPNDLLGIANCRANLHGNNLHRFLQTAAHYLATMTCVGEYMPKRETQPTLGRASLDWYG